MKRLEIQMILFGLLVVFSHNSQAETIRTGIVTATKLNVRVKPNTKYTKIASLIKGTKVTVLRIEKEWLEIIAPNTSSVWISKQYITESVSNKIVNLRAGPGIEFSSYCNLPAQSKVIILDDSKKDWVKIQVPKNLTAWVASKYIKLDEIIQPVVVKEIEMEHEKIEEDKNKTNYLSKEEIVQLSKGIDVEVTTDTEKTVDDIVLQETVDEKFIENSMIVNVATEALDNIAELEKEPIKTVKEEEVKETENEIDLPFTGKSTISAYPGIILPVNPGAAYVTHALVTKLDGEYYPIAYLHSKNINLGDWERKHIIIKGIECRVKDWKRPVIEVQEIRLFKKGEE